MCSPTKEAVINDHSHFFPDLTTNMLADSSISDEDEMDRR
jgi:hypothetical protein